MIKLTRLNRVVFYLNPMHVEQAEETPDVTITLTNGKKIVVGESMDDLVARMKSHWRHAFLSGHVEVASDESRQDGRANYKAD